MNCHCRFNNLKIYFPSGVAPHRTYFQTSVHTDFKSYIQRSFCVVYCTVQHAVYYTTQLYLNPSTQSPVVYSMLYFIHLNFTYMPPPSILKYTAYHYTPQPEEERA
jgi:hypothetical protein